MNIAVCFKVIPDMEKVIPQDWQTFDVIPDTSYTGMIISYFDESALELGLKIREENKEGRCVAITLGELPERLARRLYSVGFDEVICLSCREREFASEQIGKMLAEFLKSQCFDFILTGKQAGYMDSGTVPGYLAEYMGYPFIDEVVDCVIIQENASKRWQILHEYEEGICETQVNTPIVLSVGNASVPLLRLATLAEQMKAGKKQISFYQTKECIPLHHRLYPQEIKNCQKLNGSIDVVVDTLMMLVKKEGSV